MQELIHQLVAQQPFFAGIGYLPSAILVMLVCGLLVLTFFGLMGGVFTFLERKLAAWTNSRRGPNRVGPYGLVQFIADGVKLVLKEDIIPASADVPFFKFAPYLVLLGTALSFVVVPFGPTWIISDLNVGVLYLLATGSFTVIGLIMAGWASNNKWSLLGGMRSVAQIVSYEIPNALAILVVVLSAGTMSVQGIIASQAGGLGDWFLLSSPFTFVAFFIYFISAVAEINRIPFDIPEAESELVAGYNIEYSGMRFGAFFVAEFANVYLISAISVTCFLGGWQVPLVASVAELPGLGRGVGQFLTQPLVGWVMLAAGVAAVLVSLGCARFFVQDLRRKRLPGPSRLVRVNSEFLVLGTLLGGVGVLLALHLPLARHLPLTYSLFFKYLLPFFVFFVKSMLVAFVVLWWRWTLPRLRVDQLMMVCWMYLIPIGFGCLVGQALWLCI